MSQLPKSGDALVLVDVQVDFCPGGALPVPEGDQVVPVLNRWIGAFRERGLPIYASRDWHPRGHPSFQTEGGPWPAHCVQGSLGAELHPGLEIGEDVGIVVKGTRFDRDQLSALDETGLASRLSREKVKRLWVGGLALDACVRATVLDALAEGFDVRLLVEGTRALSPDEGRKALQEMRDAGAELEPEA